VDALPAAQPYPLPRTGIGIDVHAFAAGDTPRPLWLAGLFWEGEQGLAGHSDGDAVAHAAADALFSASGLGDLGTHFGTDRAEFKDASGLTLLSAAARIVREAGFEIGNIAVQLVANRPKFAPRRTEAAAVLSDAAGAPVSVSATTSDALGFTGRGEGIAAVATALVVARPAPPVVLGSEPLPPAPGPLPPSSVR
jgi:2-C-methyl-D-erythritol 2,4-cyclodiphosphate synthase